MTYQLQPGYAFYWCGAEPTLPRTQDWEIVVIGQRETERSQYRGKRTIDGHLHAIFHTAEKDGMHEYHAQTIETTRSQYPADTDRAKQV